MRDCVTVNVRGPVPMCRPLALLPYLTIHVMNVAVHN